MFDLQVTQTAMELLPLVCVSLLTWSGTTFAAENEPKVIRVKEGGSIILPCSLSSKQDISSQLFDWRKDHRKADEKQVFEYNGRDPSNIIITSEDERVSHFPDELKSGDASITIRDMKVDDSGVYTCIFPDLNPEQIFHIKLVVGDLKARPEIKGSAPKPSFKHLQQTRYWAQLQCETHGNPQPELLWQDSDGNNLKAEEPQVSKQGDQFYVTLQITVNKTGLYRCVATQEEIRHQINDTTHVYIEEKPAEVKPGFPYGWVVGGVLGGAAVVFVLGIIVLAMLFKTGYITLNKKDGGADYKTSPLEEA